MPNFSLNAVAAAALLISLPSQASSVPDHVSERAMTIAKSTGGVGTEVLAVKLIDDLPGLTEATLVRYRDSAGRDQSLVMLPDGEHYIPGPIAKHRGAKATLTPAAPVGHDGAPPRRDSAIPPAPKGRYQPDGYLRPESFSSIAKGVFDSMDEAPKVYMTILEDAAAVVDGTKGEEVYVMFDPACPYCIRKYKQLRPAIDRGEITVHWIPVIGPSRDHTNLLALADMSLSNQERLSLLKGMVRGISYEEQIPDRKGAQNILNRTTALLQMMRGLKSPDQPAGTPQTFYRDRNGNFRHQYGHNDTAVADLRSSMGLAGE